MGVDAVWADFKLGRDLLGREALGNKAEDRQLTVGERRRCGLFGEVLLDLGTDDGLAPDGGKKGVDIGAVECQDSYGLMLILK